MTTEITRRWDRSRKGTCHSKSGQYTIRRVNDSVGHYHELIDHWHPHPGCNVDHIAGKYPTQASAKAAAARPSAAAEREAIEQDQKEVDAELGIHGVIVDEEGFVRFNVNDRHGTEPISGNRNPTRAWAHCRIRALFQKIGVTSSEVIDVRCHTKPDFDLRNHGTISVLTPICYGNCPDERSAHSRERCQCGAAQWLWRHAPEDALSWGGNGLVLEHRYVEDWVINARNAGFAIEACDESGQRIALLEGK